MPFERAPVRLHTLLLPLMLLLPVACILQIPLQSWDEGRGPVVPHDTFPGDCRLCHVEGSWHEIRSDFTFDHEKETGVRLEGAHERATCLRCHNDRGPVAMFARRGCSGCHLDEHRGQLGSQCQDCHSQDDWRPNEQIARHGTTRFPLVGAHAAVACWRCHAGAQVGNFVGASTRCEDCHREDLARTTAPDHSVQGWTDGCDRCHVPTAWQNARFAHPASFPLTNAHSGRRCTDCHMPNVFTGLSPVCSTCHMDDYTSAAEPQHGAAGFGTGCDSCHGTAVWSPSRWPHPGSFPLTLGHAGRRCSECHSGGVFAGTPSSCNDCHSDDYAATTDPRHSTAGFGTDCAMCHGTAIWKPSNFRHPVSFPLAGAHAATSCKSCHTGPGYGGLSTTCVSCHLADYQGTTSPNHVASNYSTDCRICHKSDLTWKGAVFNHKFPINTGAHRTLGCNDCHTTVGNNSVFSCTHCHEHRKSEADSEHREVNGYQWLSSACYSCHPNGRDD